MTFLDTAMAMDPATIATFMGAALILYLTPGADMIFTVASGLSGGPRAGLAAAAGISLGVVIHTLIAAAGIAALLAASPATYDAIRYLGAAYLVWLAVKSWNAAPIQSAQDGQRRIARAFWRGLVTNLLNPKVALFILALLPQFTDPAIGPVSIQILILGLILATGGIVTDGAYGVLAGKLSARISKTSTLMNRASALIFGGLAARLAIDP